MFKLKIKVWIMLISIALLILVSPIAFAYPILIIEKGVNKTQAKEIVYSIPENYFKYVNRIIFTNKQFARCEIIDVFGQKRCFKGWASARWNKKHICTSTIIIMADLNRARLIHESNHIYDYCFNKVNISTEKFADNFRIK